MAQQITVEIDAAGNVKVGSAGVRGTGCYALTKAIESAIGKTSIDEKTSEFFQGAVCSIPQPAKVNQ